jgi:hypothetical protein
LAVGGTVFACKIKGLAAKQWFHGHAVIKPSAAPRSPAIAAIVAVAQQVRDCRFRIRIQGLRGNVRWLSTAVGAATSKNSQTARRECRQAWVLA